MPFRIRYNLYWCVSGGRAIFLDAEADRYFCLSHEANAAFVRLVQGETAPGDAELLRSIIARGMPIDDPACVGQGPPHELPPPRGDLVPEPCPSSNVLDIVRALFAETKAEWLLRTKSFLEVLNHIVTPAVVRRPADDVDRTLRRIVSSFAALSLVLRATDRCLVRAIAVHSLCRRHGITTRLVLGVRTNPFGAHSWVQLDGMVLVGDFEQVRLYTPILELG